MYEVKEEGGREEAQGEEAPYNYEFKLAVN